MTLDVGKDYLIRFADGTSNIFQVVSNDGDGWCTVKQSCAHPQAQAAAPLQKVNLRQVISVERPYESRLSWAEVEKAEEKAKAKLIREKQESERREQARNDTAGGGAFGCVLALVVVIVIVIAFLKFAWDYADPAAIDRRNKITR